MTRVFLTVSVLALMLFSCSTPTRAYEGCYEEPITANTPTGIAGCEVWGEGVGSHYGPGNGVAMNFCTWERRHDTGCGYVTVQSESTGLSVTVPVVDFCDCYTGTESERVVDMQYGVVDALGLDLAIGLYAVSVVPADGLAVFKPEPTEPAIMMLPDTATPENCGGVSGVLLILTLVGGVVFGGVLVAVLAARRFHW